MKVQSKFIFIFIILLLYVRCRKETEINDSEIREQYFRLEKIGWKSKVQNQLVDDINFTATEVPIQYYLLKDKGKEDLFLIDSLYESNKFERVVEFTFHHDEEKDLLENKFTQMSYEDGIKYLSFKVNDDFYLVTSKNDTIKCNGVNYERNFKIAPFQKILLFFSGIDPEEKIQLVYNDKLYQKGIIKFKFKEPVTEIKL